MKKEKEDLLEGLLGKAEPGAVAETKALMLSERNKPPVVEAYRAMESMLPARIDSELAEYLRCALIGVSVGFAQRHLSPYVAEHLEIVPPLLEDIRSVFLQIKGMEAEIDREAFRHQAFDYGIHKALYLDWRLYLSKDMY